MKSLSYIEEVSQKRWWNPYTWLMALLAVVAGIVVGIAWSAVGIVAGFIEGARRIWK